MGDCICTGDYFKSSAVSALVEKIRKQINRWNPNNFWHSKESVTGNVKYISSSYKHTHSFKLKLLSEGLLMLI